MNARTTTLTTALAAAVVGALAFAATAPADAITPTPTPTPTVSASAMPQPTATPTASPTASATPVVTPTPTAAPSPILTPTPTPTPTPPAVPLPVVLTVNKHAGHTAGWRTATITGTRFLNLAAVQIGNTPAEGLQVLSDTRAQFVIPNAIDFQPRVDQITVTAWSDSTIRGTGLTFQYKVADKIDRQMAYAGKYWNVYSNSTFGYLSGSDCANFASQTLLARGWVRSAQWFNYGAGNWSGTWVSSTALSSWLKKRTDLATLLTYTQRDAVAVGDVVQFRWPGHGTKYTSWDHTGIVSKVVVLPNGHHDIYYTSHTLNRQYGGSTAALAAWYGSQKIKGSTLRIQFFHLLK